MLLPHHRLALLMHNGIKGSDGKTGLAMLRYQANPIVALIDQDSAGESLRALTGIDRAVPIVGSVQEALAYGPDVLAIGIAPSGGRLPEAWLAEVMGAVAAGVSVANGLHSRIPVVEPLREGQWVWEIRQEPEGFALGQLSVGRGAARLLPGRRVLTVGTDMAIGKMTVGLELDRAARGRGVRSKFLGTGQAGILISGAGVPLDAVRVDFASGAVEQLVLAGAVDQEVVWVEGQGSLLNPASTATLPLLRGCQPTQLILVHRAGQTHIRKAQHVVIGPLREVVEMYESVARAAGAFGAAKVVGVALNTAHLSPEEARGAIEETQEAVGLPCCDVVRDGAGLLLDAVLGAEMPVPVS